ncbi:hypothetical protein [Allopusillimonas ginsengisoli]|uniref:hypothetical protein n=1 Tax=Allopusillimonas ginsengisoli TaxID=453575 RepID=UPI00101F2D84|nr:hypothetical protein [Allopusillimonas ginsengisoli]TEA79491.1 hypothetical protein ERE07_00575 [Allopusillimonas ginsengisoli]
MNLTEKLAKLQQKQKQLEVQIKERQAARNSAVARVLAVIVTKNPRALTSLLTDQFISQLSKRDQILIKEWAAEFGHKPTPKLINSQSTAPAGTAGFSG